MKCYTMSYYVHRNQLTIVRQESNVTEWWQDFEIEEELYGDTHSYHTEPKVEDNVNPVVEFRNRYLAFTGKPLPLSVNIELQD